MRRPRIRRWAKWVCTLSAVAALGVTVASRFWVLVRDTFDAATGTFRMVVIGGGAVIEMEYALGAKPGVSYDGGWTLRDCDDWSWGLWGSKPGFPSGWSWRCGVLYWHAPGKRAVGVSLVGLTLLTAIPAALLWYIDRRRHKPGACASCGYDRSGLGAGVVCPECGSAPAG